MKTNVKETENALSLTFQSLACPVSLPPMVIPQETWASLADVAPEVQRVEVERRRKQEAREIKERERSMKKLRRMRQPMHRGD